MMTIRQKDALDFIKAYIAEHGVSPTYDEIKVGLGLHSKCGINRLVMGLVERGFISHIPGLARSINLLDPDAYDLPNDVAGMLRAYCRQSGEAPAAVISQAVRRFITVKEQVRTVEFLFAEGAVRSRSVPRSRSAPGREDDPRAQCYAAARGGMGQYRTFMQP